MVVGKFLTVAQAAEVLGLHRDTLVKAADEGKIRSYRTPGGHRRFRPEDVERFLADGETAVTA